MASLFDNGALASSVASATSKIVWELEVAELEAEEES